MSFLTGTSVRTGYGVTFVLTPTPVATSLPHSDERLGKDVLRESPIRRLIQNVYTLGPRSRPSWGVPVDQSEGHLRRPLPCLGSFRVPIGLPVPWVPHVTNSGPPSRTLARKEGDGLLPVRCLISKYLGFTTRVETEPETRSTGQTG